jgi:hypothetical protein
MPKTIDFILAVARKILSMRGKGIASIANRSDVESKAGEIAAIFQQAGLPMNRLGEFIKSEKDVTKYLNIIEGSAKSKVKQSIQPEPLMKSSKSGDVIDFPPERITDWTKARPQPPEIEMIDGVQTTRGMGDLFSKQMRNIGKKKDPALYEDRGGNIIPAQFEIHPTSEIAKSLRLEAEAAKKLKNMSEAEIKLRGNRPYDTDEQIIARIEKQNKEAAERLRNKKNKDLEDPEKFAAGGVAGLLGERTGYAVGNQVMPAVDPRMNVDYNTLVDQNTAQRATQAQARNPVLQRMQNAQNAPSASETLGNLYNKQGIAEAENKYIDQVLASTPTYKEKMNKVGDLMSGSGFVSDLRHKTAAAQLRDSLGGGIMGNIAANVGGAFREIPQLLTGNFKGVGEDLKANYGGKDIPVGLTPQESYDYLIAQQQVDPGVAAEPSAMPQGSSGQLNPTMADVAGPAYRPGFQGEFLTTGPSRDKLFTDVVPDFDKYGNYIGKDQLIKDYAAAGRGTASSQLVKLPENHPYAVSGAGYYTYNGTDFSKTADENMTPEYEKMIRSNYGLASGGRAGFYQGGQAQIEPDLSGIGHGSDALMARNMLIAPGSQATTSTGLNYLLGEDNDTTRVPYKEKGSVTLADLIKVNASGSKSGKNQIMGAPDGITADTETFNAIIKMDIPIMEKINLLGSYGYGKDRFKVEKGNKELFLGEDGYKDRNIGLGFNQDGEGLSGSVIRNLETGDNDYQLKLLKSFAEGGRIGYNEGNMVVPKPKAMDEYLLKQVMSQAGANTLDVRTRKMFIEELKKKIRDKRATEEKKYQFEELRDQGAEDMYYDNREKELDIKYNPQNYPPSMRKFAGGGVAGLLGESPGSTDHGPRTNYKEAGVVDKIGGMVNYKNVPHYLAKPLKGVTNIAEWMGRLPFAATELASDMIRKPLFKAGDKIPGLPGVGAKFVGGEMFEKFGNNMETGALAEKLGLTALADRRWKKFNTGSKNCWRPLNQRESLLM